MKGYSVVHRPIGVVFDCDKCDYKIELAREFPGEKQPRQRTLAATRMNDHIAKTHPIAQSSLNDYGIK